MKIIYSLWIWPFKVDKPSIFHTPCVQLPVYKETDPPTFIHPLAYDNSPSIKRMIYITIGMNHTLKNTECIKTVILEILVRELRCQNIMMYSIKMDINWNNLFSTKAPGPTREPHRLPLGMQDEISICILLLIKYSNILPLCTIS